VVETELCEMTASGRPLDPQACGFVEADGLVITVPQSRPVVHTISRDEPGIFMRPRPSAKVRFAGRECARLTIQSVADRRCAGPA